ncbi:MAG: ribulose-phosphate 3-epimerase [Planctomycetales bacterium]|nr:ribulose-phosphate 3-epimerase [Planctomycetales bacterium]
MTQNRRVHRLRSASPAVLPSLLMCDFGNLERELMRLEGAGVEALHLDVMDGSFVPNLTYGFPIIEALRRLTDLPLDVHLMIDHPERYINHFAHAGADLITIHVEATEQPGEVLNQIRSLGLGSGLALNPDTPLTRIERFLDQCDLVLVMSVNAGFGGQKFNTIALEKLRRLNEIRPAGMMLEVDGGVNSSTIASCAAAGADLFVVGSAIFGQDNYTAAVHGLNELLQTA